MLNNDVLTPARLEGLVLAAMRRRGGGGWLACAALLLRTLRTIGMTQSANRCVEMDAGIVIMLEARRRHVAASRTTPERQWSRLDEIRRYRRERKSKWPSKKRGGRVTRNKKLSEVLASDVFAESWKLLAAHLETNKADSDEAPARVRAASRLDTAASEHLLDVGSSRLTARDALLLA